jgi:tetratricopeptide (TPR) repeat protein
VVGRLEEPIPPPLALAALYASGQRAEAIARLDRWSESELKEELVSLRSLRNESGGHLHEGLLRAAVMLHTDREAYERLQAPVVESARECGINRHAGYARSVNSLLAVGSEPAREFSRRWVTAMALTSHWDLCFADVLRWTREGLKWFPRDAELLLVQGTAEEVQATLVPPPLFVQKNPAQMDRAGMGRRRRDLEDARRHLEAALAVEPELHEARVRLGRVLWRLEKPAEARPVLEAAIERAREPHLVYLANLFQGRILEEAGDLAEAAERYRAALKVDPIAQAAAIALSQVLLRSGQDAEAREVLDRALRHAPRAQPRDAHMSYHLGRSNLAEGILDDLREETLQ